MAWTPSLRASCFASEEEPGVIEMEVFHILDADGNGFLTLQEMEPLLLGNCERNRAVAAQMRRCKRPEDGFSPREFAAAFRKDNRNLVAFYQNIESHEASNTSGYPSPTPACNDVSSIARQGRRSRRKGQAYAAAAEADWQEVVASVAVLVAEDEWHLSMTPEKGRRRSCSFAAEPDLQAELAPDPPALLEAEASASAAAPGRRQRRRTAPAGASMTRSVTAPSLTLGGGNKRGSRSARGDKREEPIRRWRPVAEKPAVETEELPPRRLGVHFDVEEVSALADSGLSLRTIVDVAVDKEKQLLDALAEIERLKEEKAGALAEIERLAAQGNGGGRGRSMSMGGVGEFEETQRSRRQSGASRRSVSPDSEDEEEEALQPLPPDTISWDWPLSRHEKKARIQLLERQMHAMDRKSLLQELRRGASSCCDSDSDS